MSSVAILDIGHGNCAVVYDESETLVIDTGTGNTLLLFLREKEITHINKVLISHADADHIGGLIALLSSGEVTISAVCLNSDALKGSSIWKALVYELHEKAKSGQLEFTIELTDLHKDSHSFSQFSIDILAPSAALAALGPGSHDIEGRKITTNTISSVIKVSFIHGGISILFAADMDDTSLKNILENEYDLAANVLVFPHHGGRAGSETLDNFTKELYGKVNPEVVIFSIGRGRHSTPRPEIVACLKESDPEIKILCTQLSNHCSAKSKILDYTHLMEAFACGKDKMKSCAGTVVLTNKGMPELIASSKLHKSFVEQYIETPLCM